MKEQVNGPLRRESKPEWPEKPPENQSKNWYHIFIRGEYVCGGVERHV